MYGMVSGYSRINVINMTRKYRKKYNLISKIKFILIGVVLSAIVLKPDVFNNLIG